MIKKQIFVTGKVQGVGFRQFTKKIAKRRGLQGWVRNLKDKRVEIQVQGHSEEVQGLINEIKKGPPGSKVDHLEIQDLKESDFDESFVVKESEAEK